MVAPDPNDEQELADHIALLDAQTPDYTAANPRKCPVDERARFPDTLPLASEMTEAQIAELQLAYCLNEVDFIKNPHYVRECLWNTHFQKCTYQMVVRYAWDRLRGQYTDVQKAEDLIEQLQVPEDERGYGRRGEARIDRAQHVGDEEWLANANLMEMRNEMRLASEERFEMELSEHCLLDTVRIEMDANLHWGGENVFDRSKRPPMEIIPFEQNPEAQAFWNGTLRRSGGTHRSSARGSGRSNGTNIAKHGEPSSGASSNSPQKLTSASRSGPSTSKTKTNATGSGKPNQPSAMAAFLSSLEASLNNSASPQTHSGNRALRTNNWRESHTRPAHLPNRQVDYHRGGRRERGSPRDTP